MSNPEGAPAGASHNAMIRAHLIAASLFTTACATTPSADGHPVEAFVSPQPAGPGRQVAVFVLQHTSAEEVAPLLRSVVNPTQCGRYWRGLSPDPPRKEWGPDYLGVTATAGNRIVVDGTPELIADAQILIERLDVVIESSPSR